MHENGITADSSEISVDPASSFLTCRASRSSCRDHFRSQMSLGPDTYDRKFLLVSQHFGISSREDIFLFRDILTTLDDVRTRWIKRYRSRPPKDFRDILTASHDVPAGNPVDKKVLIALVGLPPPPKIPKLMLGFRGCDFFLDPFGMPS